MSLLWGTGSPGAELSSEDLKRGLFEALEKLGPRRKVLAVPPDITRLHSRAGELTLYLREYYGERLTDVLPALGTHLAMTPDEIREMYGELDPGLFRRHDWRRAPVKLGEAPREMVRELSGGLVDFSYPVQVNRMLIEGGYDLIVSIGQVVPHEVSGMANYTKNLVVGTGGAEAINKSHFLGAVHGIERILGRAENPVRRLFDYADGEYLRKLPVVYVLTVIGRTAEGRLVARGMFIGEDRECFERAAELSQAVNVELLERPLHKVVAYLDPAEYKSTWLGNKAIYRTRMAIADGGELVVLAPGVARFGEDDEIDRLIRKYGYVGRERVLAAVAREPDLGANLSAAAHLIHGSSEGRFRITYCPGKLTREEIEGVHFGYGDLAAMMRRYDPGRLADGFNLVDGEEIFFVRNPATGLWTWRERFEAAA
ncbi:MAG: lactate racemase domain-containing protein [Bryobacterales bacterium]|nr:lactate racemase domain-containing protein [Bryobacterales bacterium]